MGLTPQRHEGAGVTALYKAAGAANCNDTGYRGRTGIYELLVVDDDIRQLVLEGGLRDDQEDRHGQGHAARSWTTAPERLGG